MTGIMILCEIFMFQVLSTVLDDTFLVWNIHHWKLWKSSAIHLQLWKCYSTEISIEQIISVLALNFFKPTVSSFHVYIERNICVLCMRVHIIWCLHCAQSKRSKWVMYTQNEKLMHTCQPFFWLNFFFKNL